MPACRGSMFWSTSRRAKSSSRRFTSRPIIDAGTSKGSLEAEELLVEAGRIRFRAELDADVGVPVGRAPRVAPLEVHDQRVAVIDAAAFDRLEARRAIAQALQRELHRFVVDRARRAAQGD